MTIRMLAAAVLVGLVVSPLQAQDGSMEERVAELRAMEPAERRAVLKAMAPEERRGLWFQVKKADREQQGGAGPEAGFYRDALAAEGGGNDASAQQREAGSRAVGTITYDDGVGTVDFGGGALVGNRFDTHTGIPVLASGTVSTVVGVVVPGRSVTNSSAGFVLLGPQTTGGGASAIFSSWTAGLTAGTETVTFTGIGANYTGDSFHVLFGDFANGYVPTLGQGTTNGQGYHGLVGYTGGQGPNITGTFNFGEAYNALVRASGNILPVELMEFGVE